MAATNTLQGSMTFTAGGEGCKVTLQRTKNGADVDNPFQVDVTNNLAIFPDWIDPNPVTQDTTYGIRIISTTCKECTGDTTTTVQYSASTCP